ncbi:unnamed protein product, partial [Ixodes hexagonus]
QAKPPAGESTTTMDENLNSLPDIRLGTENLSSDDRPNGNVFTITQPVSSGRSSPANMSFRMKNVQPDSVSRADLCIFGCVVCVMGIAWLVFLHVDLTRYKLLILERIKKTLKEYEDIADRISLTTECVINGQYAWPPKVPEDENQEDLVPHYRFLKGRHSGSFFLKTGTAVFCSGHIIHEGLMLSKGVIDWNNDPESCRDVTNVLLHTLRPIYSFYQLFIVFKYSNV